jgi:hypothetical protein
MSQVTRRQARRTGVRAMGFLPLALFGLSLGLTTAAQAEIIQIAAITFVGRSDVEEVGDAQKGTLTNATGTFYAPVQFRNNGEVVCRFTLVHHDGDSDPGNDITARLMKKRIIVGSSAFLNPLVMATVTTTSGVSGVQRLDATEINQAVLDLNRAFYYVELTVPAKLVETLGVQIVVKPAC